LGELDIDPKTLVRRKQRALEELAREVLSGRACSAGTSTEYGQDPPALLLYIKAF
jgi:hypothetical protein